MITRCRCLRRHWRAAMSLFCVVQAMKENCQIIQTFEYAANSTDASLKDLLTLSWDKWRYNMTRHISFTAFPCKGNGWEFKGNENDFFFADTCQKSCLEDRSCIAWIWTDIGTGMLGDTGCHQAYEVGIDWQWCDGVDLDSAGILLGQILQRGEIHAHDKAGKWAEGLVKLPIVENRVIVTPTICGSLCRSSWHCHAWLYNSRGCWLEDRAKGYQAQAWHSGTAEAEHVTAGETIKHFCKFMKIEPANLTALEAKHKNATNATNATNDSVYSNGLGRRGAAFAAIALGVIAVGGFFATMRVPMCCCSPFIACRGYILGKRNRATGDRQTSRQGASSVLSDYETVETSPEPHFPREGTYRILSLIQHEPEPPLATAISPRRSPRSYTQPLVE